MTEPLYAASPRSRAIRLLREMIADGTLPVGAQLPSERALAGRLDVPRTTVNRAVQALQEAGLIKHLGGRARIVTERGARRGLMARTVVVVAPPLDHAGIQGVAEDMTVGCERELRADDLFTLIVSSREIGPEDLRRLAQEQPLGVIVTDVSVGSRVRPEALAAALEPVSDAGIPVVLFGGEVDRTGFDRVESDHETGGYLVTRHLIERGRRRILFHAGDGTALRWKEQRLAGYRRAMVEAGLEPLPPLDIPAPARDDLDTEARARAQMGFLHDHCSGAAPIDGLLALTDAYLPSLARACSLLGRDPEADLDLAGYDNYFARSEPVIASGVRPVATVDKRTFTIGIELARVLRRRLAEPDIPVISQRVEPELIAVH